MRRPSRLRCSSSATWWSRSWVIARSSADPAIRPTVVSRSTTSRATGPRPGTVTATTPDGHVLYKGLQRLVVRTNVRRAEGVPITLPPKPDGLSPDERIARRQAAREARIAELESRGEPAKIITVPFEISLLRTPDDALGQQLLSEQKVIVVKFTTDDGVLTVNGRGFRGILTGVPVYDAMTGGERTRSPDERA